MSWSRGPGISGTENAQVDKFGKAVRKSKPMLSLMADPKAGFKGAEAYGVRQIGGVESGKSARILEQSGQSAGRDREQGGSLT
jgi:hypothetical protein